MADTKITALAAITTVDPAADVLPIVDISDTSMAASGTTKKITSNQILGAGGTATLASATITGDLTVDTSTLVVDATNNYVGIGTASPAVSLDIRGASAAATLEVLRLQNTGGGANTKTRLNFYAASTNYGSITGGFGASNPELIFDINTSTGQFIWNNFGSEAMRLNTTANLVLKGGTTGANGVGVTFPATQVASSDANCLDDYEEGTWAPSVGGEVNLTSTTFVSARYTKIGRVVTVSGSVTTFIITSNTLAYFALQNLPFTAATNVPGPLWNDTRNTSGTTQVAGTILYGFLSAASGTTSGSAMTLTFSNTYTV